MRLLLITLLAAISYAQTDPFIRVEDGESCTSGRIKDATTCEKAASALGYKWTASWNGPNDAPGCILAIGGRDKVYFNTALNANGHHPYYAELCQETVVPYGDDYLLYLCGTDKCEKHMTCDEAHKHLLADKDLADLKECPSRYASIEGCPLNNMWGTTQYLRLCNPKPNMPECKDIYDKAVCGPGLYSYCVWDEERCHALTGLPAGAFPRWNMAATMERSNEKAVGTQSKAESLGENVSSNSIDVPLTLFAAIGACSITYYTCRAIYNSIRKHSEFTPITQEV